MMVSIGLGLIILFAIGGYLQSRRERRRWNNGVDVHTGRRWRRFDIDSQGGRMYTNDAYSVDRRFCDVSYNHDSNYQHFDRHER